MPLYLDTRGRTKIAIAICGRCGVKYPYDDLSDDPNFPGLRVCPDGCKDKLDPWRLPARATEDITLEYSRPDVAIDTEAETPAFFVPAIYGLTSIGFARPWQPNTYYTKGQSITPLDVNLETTPLPQYWYVATTSGTSGATPPIFTPIAGVIIYEGWTLLTTDDGAFLTDDSGNPLAADVPTPVPQWLCLGVYPN